MEAAQADDTGTKIQATINTLRPKLVAEGVLGDVISSQMASEKQLLDLSESRFPMQFPGHPSTRP